MPSLPRSPKTTAPRSGRPPTARRSPLLKGLGHYKSLTFDEKGGQLAFLSDRDDYKDERLSPSSSITGPIRRAPRPSELASGTAKGMPQGMAVSENGRLSFSKDGTKLFFGYAAPPQPEPAEDAPEPVKVDIWSYKDPELQPMQKLNADQEKKRSYQAVVHFLPRRRSSSRWPAPTCPA